MLDQVRHQLKVRAGKPYPLGATHDGLGVNFAIFSANAEKIELCLFDTQGVREVARLPLPGRTQDIWHVYLPDAVPGALYGYRVFGPYDPANGHRFNHHKLLIDPCARELSGRLINADENHGYVIGSSELDLSFDQRDNASFVPKCVVPVSKYVKRVGDKPRTPILESVIYEGHVKGLTMKLPGISSSKRGTYAGLASETFVRHLKDLGVTALELLPIHAFADEAHLEARDLKNYWGYNSYSFFAPDRRYADKEPVREFRKMVRALHAENIEVILDVVYNHTAEGNELGPTLCYRGIDNASYYRLMENRRYYVNDTGCGNTLNCAHPSVIQLIMDSLRYWVTEMNVDGFRFDLATVLGRESYGFDTGCGLFDAIHQDPVLSDIKLIAEPWDCGPGGYQLGHFPAGWSEWNDHYRDVVREFWNGKEGSKRRLAKAVHGSSEKFEWQSRGPEASLNLITAHDGFTLRDLVSYDERHNEANGENNEDGHSHNLSVNHGVEGPSSDAEISASRDRHRLNLMATLLLSQGVPMILAGDEFGRTQQGNNNAYCQDNEISWLDWSRKEGDSVFYKFTQSLVALRRNSPVLRRARFLHGHDISRTKNLLDIQWLNAKGETMSQAEWEELGPEFFGIVLVGDAGMHLGSDGESQVNETLLILVNNSPDNHKFPLPDNGENWILRLDTANPVMRDEAVEGYCRSTSRSMLVCSSGADHTL